MGPTSTFPIHLVYVLPFLSITHAQQSQTVTIIDSSTATWIDDYLTYPADATGWITEPNETSVTGSTANYHGIFTGDNNFTTYRSFQCPFTSTLTITYQYIYCGLDSLTTDTTDTFDILLNDESLQNYTGSPPQDSCFASSDLDASSCPGGNSGTTCNGTAQPWYIKNASVTHSATIADDESFTISFTARTTDTGDLMAFSGVQITCNELTVPTTSPTAELPTLTYTTSITGLNESLFTSEVEDDEAISFVPSMQKNLAIIAGGMSVLILAGIGLCFYARLSEQKAGTARLDLATAIENGEEEKILVPKSKAPIAKTGGKVTTAWEDGDHDDGKEKAETKEIVSSNGAEHGDGTVEAKEASPAAEAGKVEVATKVSPDSAAATVTATDTDTAGVELAKVPETKRQETLDDLWDDAMDAMMDQIVQDVRDSDIDEEQ
eukprot:CAMPEP_0197025114 /NCGR_PEP_ID=MMETSP1384-20130603/5536_1 /TAXON_ID=29189 /ORGANISM="Ammonia sp." /LENGTH=435 /DNA_ID=CAMNT_0042453605 /DNA_START=55 /DNA_END=1362 /DNA_ORIENTATION=+